MRVRKLDANGDATFGHSQADFYVDQPEAVAQVVLTSLKLLKGEWFVDTTKGIAWLTDVVGVRTAGTRDRAIRACILGVQGVKSILSYSSAVTGRAFTASVTIDTIYGAASLSLSQSASGGITGQIDYSVPGNPINTTV